MEKSGKKSFMEWRSFKSIFIFLFLKKGLPVISAIWMCTAVHIMTNKHDGPSHFVDKRVSNSHIRQ